MPLLCQCQAVECHGLTRCKTRVAPGRYVCDLCSRRGLVVEPGKLRLHRVMRMFGTLSPAERMAVFTSLMSWKAVSTSFQQVLWCWHKDRSALVELTFEGLPELQIRDIEDLFRTTPPTLSQTVAGQHCPPDWVYVVAVLRCLWLHGGVAVDATFLSTGKGLPMTESWLCALQGAGSVAIDVLGLPAQLNIAERLLSSWSPGPRRMQQCRHDLFVAIRDCEDKLVFTFATTVRSAHSTRLSGRRHQQTASTSTTSQLFASR